MGPGEEKKRRKRKNDGSEEKETYAQKLRKRKERASNAMKEQTEKQNLKNPDTEPRIPLSCVNHSRQSDVSNLFEFRPRACEPKINIFTPSTQKSRNLIHYMQQYSFGQKCTVQLKQSVSNMVVNILSEMQLCQTVSPFDRRVTAMEWHPTKSNIIAVGSKGGDIMMWDVSNSKNEKFIQGIGAGGIINAIKFWPDDNEKILSAAVDGTVTLHDIAGQHTQILADTCNAHDYWYCSIDVHAGRKCVAAGDNVGNTQLLSYDGKKVFNSRLHKQKVTHCAFSPREEWLLCTASTDQTVKFWDVRMMKDRGSVLYTLKHDKPVNSAYFSRTDGCRLLTTDQNNQVRVYRAPDWSLEKTILHPHRFFQHITPIKATWYPLQDLAVVGRYPDPKFPTYHDGELRTIDIIDVESEKVVTSLSDPSASGLICVNQFNNTGDTLASGMGLHVLLWKRKEEMIQLQESLTSKVGGPTNLLKSGGPPRSRSEPKKKSQTKKKMDTETKQAQTKLKMKLKNSKK